MRNVAARSYGHAASNVGQANTRRFSATPVHQPSYAARQNAIVRQHTTNLNSNAGVLASQQNFQSNHNVRARNYVATNRGKSFNLNRNRNLNVGAGNNVAITNNWRGQQFSGQNYSAFRNYSREWHDRDWWRHNHSRITFYFGAPYYWDAGYWYPAWGYYPDSVYQYDGPIYGYNDLAPNQVILNVQGQLQRDGYYAGPIDGVLGPITRAAIARFQADHGLAITSAIDEPTLATLGLV